VRSACLLVVACRWPIRLSVARWTPKPASTPDWVPNRPLHCPLDTQTCFHPRLGAQSTTPLPAGHPNPRPPATGCPTDHSIARCTTKPTPPRDWVPNRPLHCPLDTQTHDLPRLGAQSTTPLPAGHPNPRPPATGCPTDHSRPAGQTNPRPRAGPFSTTRPGSAPNTTAKNPHRGCSGQMPLFTHVSASSRTPGTSSLRRGPTGQRRRWAEVKASE
jgi:hypothetical protein